MTRGDPGQSTARLHGKAVVITGAGNGLGRSYALAAGAAGASVIVDDVEHECAAETASQIRAAGGVAVASDLSVADPTSCERVVQLCRDEFGSIDGLVNNAGIVHQAPPWEESAERLRTLVEVNVLGAMWCGVAAIRAMREQVTGGSIINVSSGASLGVPLVSAYGATKGALMSLSYGWALDLQDTPIRVNCLAPTARTRMVTDIVTSTEHLVPRSRTPDRVAPVVVFLLSDRARGITGQFVRFDGDRLQLVAPPEFVEPSVARDQWSVGDVADAFDEILRPALQPFGQTRVRVGRQNSATLEDPT